MADCCGSNDGVEVVRVRGSWQLAVKGGMLFVDSITPVLLSLSWWLVPASTYAEAEHQPLGVATAAVVVVVVDVVLAAGLYRGLRLLPRLCAWRELCMDGVEGRGRG